MLANYLTFGVPCPITTSRVKSMPSRLYCCASTYNITNAQLCHSLCMSDEAKRLLT